MELEHAAGQFKLHNLYTAGGVQRLHMRAKSWAMLVVRPPTPITGQSRMCYIQKGTESRKFFYMQLSTCVNIDNRDLSLQYGRFKLLRMPQDARC